MALLNADGVTNTGHGYLDLLLPGSQLAPNESTLTRTVTILTPEGKPFDLGARLIGDVEPNVLPTIDSTPDEAAEAGQLYSYQIAATDPDGLELSYALVDGPTDVALDTDGHLTWTPQPGDSMESLFLVRAYDERGGFDDQSWSVVVSATNTPPVLPPMTVMP